MADAGVWRNNLEILKRRLPPAKECVALDVALKFQLRIQAEGVHVAKIIDLYGMVDNQLGGEQWIDSFRTAAHALHSLAHGGEIDDCGHSREVLQEDPRGHESNLFFRSTRPPVRQRPDVLGMDKPAILAAQQILQKNTQRKRQFRQVGDALLFKKLEAMNIERLGAHAQFVASPERIARVDGHPDSPFAVVRSSLS